MTEQKLDVEQTNKATIEAAFADWAAGSGGPFALLAPDATWTIVGTTPVSRTYTSRKEFIDVVIDPFNARMATPLVPTVRALYADGDTVIAFFEGTATAKDGKPYQNIYTWYMRMRDGAIVEVTAFFDTVEFTELWNRIAP